MKAKKIICLLMACMILFSVSACGMMSLNTEKDASTVVAKVNGKEYTKASFNNFLTTYYVLYEIYGYTIPEGDDLKTFKENLFNSYVFNLTYYEDALAAGATPEDGAADTAYDNIIAAAEQSLGSAEALDTVLAKYELDRDGFKQVSEEYRTLSAYANAYDAMSPDFHDAVQGTAVKVNKAEINVPTFNFYNLTLMLINYYYYNTSPSTESDYLSYLDTTVNYVAYTQALIDYAAKEGYEFTDEECIAKFDESFEAITAIFGEEYLGSYYKSYYLTDEEIAAAKAFIGRGYMTEEKIQAQFEEETVPTEEEVGKYYLDNASSFSATVGAYHILTESETKARELQKQAGGTKEGFMKLYEQIKAAEGTDKADEDIKEAADLGEFKYTAMVEEFAEPVFAMEVDEVKGMIETEFGYHLVYKYSQSDVPTLENNYDEIAAKCKAAAVSDAKTAKLNELRTAASVTEKDYRKTNDERVSEYLADKYSVKTYENKALR